MQSAGQLVNSPISNLELVFTGDSAAMIAARDRVMDFLHEQGISEQEEIDILVALQEALVNAVVHGCKNDPSQVIHCSAEVDVEAITIVIKDPGEGFDTVGACDSTEGGTNLTEHGRGICLMRSLMDKVSYSHGGSQVHLTKRRAPADTVPAILPPVSPHAEI